jgi:Cys-tRNA(Pro)/Cys-tRNA(Cys) deacylase
LAQTLSLPCEQVYKTLVTVGKSKAHYVFVIPVAEEIDFKKAAKVVGEKSLEMLPLKDLTAVTGYIRGGCTSVGMKKKFKTAIQEDAMLLDKIVVSGGRLGLQLVLKPDDLLKAAEAEYADVIVTRKE